LFDSKRSPEFTHPTKVDSYHATQQLLTIFQIIRVSLAKEQTIIRTYILNHSSYLKLLNWVHL